MAQLTDREREGATLASQGLSSKEIAERLRTLYQGRASLDIQAAESMGSRVTILIPRSGAAT